MEELLRFLEKYEIWIYVVGGVVLLITLQKLVVSWQEWRRSVFGLERDSAQRRFSTAMTLVILVALFMLAEFTLVSFVSPSLPQTSLLPTPTLDLLSTPTLEAQPTAEGIEIDATPTIPVVALATVPAGQCVPGQLEWTEPLNGAQISGTVALKGTINVQNFGFYKYEFTQPQGESWSTIAAGNQMVTNGEIGNWNTTALTPGDYLLRLVVIDNKDKPLPACVIQVRIVAPPSDQ